MSFWPIIRAALTGAGGGGTGAGAAAGATAGLAAGGGATTRSTTGSVSPPARVMVTAATAQPVASAATHAATEDRRPAHQLTAGAAIRDSRA